MARFVVAGEAGCPYFARAELLAEALQGSLPDFRVHKVSILPGAWTEWLDSTCKRNGWKHERSPLVWRELVGRGGKGVLLGGFGEFLHHCQDYYGPASDLSTEVQQSLEARCAENLEAARNLAVEEQHRAGLIKPLHVWISSALNPTCRVLVPSLLSAEVFPRVSAISLHLLDLQGGEEGLRGLKMEIEDLALPLLHQVSIHPDLEQAFREADVILLLDECWSDGSSTENMSPQEKKRSRGKEISERYREYGQLIDSGANREVKVIVSGDELVNWRCSLLARNARSIDGEQFVTVATQLENEARAVMARKLRVKASDITDVIVWGNISGSFYVDMQRARVFNHDGPIQGPASFSQSLLNLFHHRKWLETDFQDLVRCHRAAVASKTRRAASMSAANGILSVLKTWNGSCGEDKIMSLGVLSRGRHDLPDGVVLSVPVTFKGGKWSVVSDVTVGDKLRQRLQLSADELRLEEELGTENF